MIYRFCRYLIPILLNSPLFYFRLFISHYRKRDLRCHFVLLSIRVRHSFDLFKVKNQANGLTRLNIKPLKHPLRHVHPVIVLWLQLLQQLTPIARDLLAVIKQGKLSCLLEFLCSVGLSQIQVTSLGTHFMD